MRRLIVLAVTAALLAVAGVGTALAVGATQQEADVHRFDNGGEDVGDATLTRTNSGVSMTIKSSVEGELFEFGIPQGEFFSPGDATTNWWVIFNNPENCLTPWACGAFDIFLDGEPGVPNVDQILAVQIDVLFATGHVAGAKWRAAAHLSEGDTSGSVLPLFGLEPVGLKEAQKAEVHVVVRSHGPAKNLVPGELAEAIGTILGGCETNTCGDSQFAVFPAPKP